MRKIITTVVIPILSTFIGISAFAEVEPQTLEFEPVGGGKYIYCNNPEAIDDNTLINSDKPRYIMNNEELGPGKYYLYLSHFNYAGGANVAKAIELDVELNPGKDGCEFTLSNIGFETAEVTSWYENGKWIKYEQDWGMLNACAKAMQKTICDIDGEVYYPRGENTVHEVEAKERRWISEFIPNYAKTHYMQPVHLQAILEIKSGTMDVNVCAFESGEKLGDRSTFREDAEYGIKRHDRCIKGIADTIPQVKDELSYTIDDTDEDGTYLPVHMTNSYAPEGITLNEWFIHLNPLDDPWAKAQADESGMLKFEYIDDSKLDYYGKNVPKSERDNVWRLDTRHADTHKYETKYNTGNSNDYIPNFEIDASQDSVGFATNLGNYGVTYTYELSITNEGKKTRYFTYAPTTNSNIIVYTNENGVESDYALTKKFYAAAQQDVMSVVELPPGEATEFSVNVVLPVNYNGGTKNAFIIRDSAEKIDVEELIAKTADREYHYPLNGKYLSSYKSRLPQNTIEWFDGNLDAYEVVKFGENYAVRWCAWDGKFNYYYPGWWLCSHVYILDKDLKVSTYKTFDSMPIDMSVNEDKLYIRTARDGSFESEDGVKWTSIGYKDLPEHEESEPTVTLGEVLDNTVVINHAVSDLFEVEISDAVYSRFYNIVKDMKLKRINDIPKEKGLCIDGISIEKGIEFNDKYYIIEDEEDREFVCKLLWNLVYVQDRADDGDFGAITRVNVSEWAQDGIRLAGEYGLIPYEFGDFWATKAISRGEFCDIAINVIKYLGVTDLPEKPRTKFKDTDEYNICVLAQLGIINGYEDGSFRPEGEITREEAAVIISRMLKLYNLTETSETEYQDADTIQDWARAAVDITARYNIMNGVGENTFEPKGAYTIEQSIITMLRVFNTSVNAGYLNISNLPEQGRRITVYREGYRNGRIEMAMYDTEEDSILINENNVLSVSGSYKNDVKYYFSCGRWVEFERGYDRISNNAEAVLLG